MIDKNGETLEKLWYNGHIGIFANPIGVDQGPSP